ncbi:GH11052 [Drosophila grimshawi]|uniref:GH11052 n=1 Tax=Drosophila grimshawi TaxID=7222 RepID=B4JCD9_DROGR|nr:GH11052 [Drosophila grimshawi]
MPRRNKRAGAGKDRTSDTNSEDESFDNVSVYSNVSMVQTSSEGAEELIKERSMEQFEEKFDKALEQATEKSAQTRLQALQSICELLMHRYMPDYVDDRKMTVMDFVEKSVRRGKGQEQLWGARLAPLLVLQLGGEERMSKDMSQFLLTTLLDKSVNYDARAKCCTALGLLNFVDCEDVGELVRLMQIFETIFAGSYLRGDDKTPISVTAEAGALHSEALSAWGLLLTLIPSGDFVSLMTTGEHKFPSIKKFLGLLQSPHLDVRMAAGETIALIFESGRAHDENFMDEHIAELCVAVKQLATDSHKYRAKRDRKAQRATFRDVLRYLEEDISPEINIRFGQDALTLDAWSIHHQYSSLCAIMGPGITSQLQENEFIRDIFQLGPKPTNTGINGHVTTKQSKLERHLMNAAAFKARSVARGKNRDKRSAVVT